MLHLLYRLYGRTIVVRLALVIDLDALLKRLDHVGGRRGALHGAPDVLRQVGRVDDRPLRLGPVGKTREGEAYQ